MKPTQKFPQELLDDTIDARVAYFEKLTIQHPSLNRAYDQAMAAVTGQTGPKVILITGPTGAGKTTLARRLYRAIIDKSQDRMAAEPDLIPIMYGNAIAPNGASFNWKDFYIRLLERSMEPLIDRKLHLASSRCFPNEVQHRFMRELCQMHFVAQWRNVCGGGAPRS